MIFLWQQGQQRPAEKNKETRTGISSFHFSEPRCQSRVIARVEKGAHSPRKLVVSVCVFAFDKEQNNRSLCWRDRGKYVIPTPFCLDRLLEKVVFVIFAVVPKPRWR